VISLRRTRCALLLLPLLAACHSAAKEAEAQYRLVSAHGTLGERCAAATRVRDAYLEADDQSNYALWSSRTGIDCLSASTEGSYMPSDPATRARVQAETDDTLNAADDALAAAARAVENADAAIDNAHAAISPEGAAIVAKAVPENLRRYQAGETNAGSAPSSADDRPE
jgi:hypothetical protein